MSTPIEPQFEGSQNLQDAVPDVVDPEAPARATPRKSFIAEIVVGVVLAIGAIIVLIQQLELGLGSVSAPKTGFWLFVVSIVILISIPFAIRDKSTTEVFDYSNMSRAMLMAVSLLLFVAVYSMFGFIIGGFTSLFIIIRWVCREPLLSSIVVSFAAPVAAYLLFGLIFQTALIPFQFFGS